MSENRPAKRAREEEGSFMSEPTRDIAMTEAAVEDDEENSDNDDGDDNFPQRSEVVWLHDGNIILQTESKRFRVHKSMLAKHSTVFDDMFKVPQPLEQRGKTLDACQIVKLPGDASHHWEWLLQLLYDGRR
jgi:BTB/POZ domain